MGIVHTQTNQWVFGLNVPKPPKTIRMCNTYCSLPLKMNLFLLSYSRGKHFYFCTYKLNFILNVLLALISPGLATVSPRRAGVSELEKKKKQALLLGMLRFSFSSYKSKFWRFKSVSWRHRDGLNFSRKAWRAVVCNFVNSLEIACYPVTLWICSCNCKI